MNSRERLLAAARGGDVDRAPWLVWPRLGDLAEVNDAAIRAGADAVVVRELQHVAEMAARCGLDGPAVLYECHSPFGAASSKGIDLNQAIFASPVEGSALLDTIAQNCEREAQEALELGADGVFYVLEGATPGLCTPMQYGGFFLERDRQLLDAVADARFNLMFVAGGEGTYLDFVHDLPASALAWDEPASGIGHEQVRKMHEGTIACGLFGDRETLWRSFAGRGLVFFGILDEVRDLDEIGREMNELKSGALHG
ncbi:hypothetical protein FCG40_05045 [Fimbriimonadia bacterium ATM]|nr:hypothetical protein [Fimbriimonadia bacterium ATM]